MQSPSGGVKRGFIYEHDEFERFGDQIFRKSTRDLANVSRLIAFCYGVSTREAIRLLEASDGNIALALDTIEDAQERGLL